MVWDTLRRTATTSRIWFRAQRLSLCPSVLGAAIIAFASPNSASANDHRADSGEVAASSDGDTRERARVFDAYIRIQRALAADDAVKAERSFRILAKQRALPELSSIAEEISGVRDIERLRAAFRDATRVLVRDLRSSGNPTDQTIDLAECSMAFKGSGGQWLQVDQRIANPYFGASMLQCGAFKGSAKPGETLRR